jgi:hypothetical protein
VSRVYTPQMDAVILAADTSEAVKLAMELLNLTNAAVMSRRAKLRKDLGLGDSRGSGSRSRSYHHLYQDTTPHISIDARARFARPDWFDEDLNQMTRGAVR